MGLLLVRDCSGTVIGVRLQWDCYWCEIVVGLLSV